MKQEHEADKCNDDEFLDELFLEVVHRALDKARTIVGRHDLHARREAGFKLLELGLHGVDGLQRILARAHHDDAARHLSLAVQLGDPASHFGTYLDPRHVAQAHRNAGVGRRQWNLAEVVERLQVTGSTHHILRLTQLQHRASGFLIRLLDGVDHLAVRNVVSAHPIGIEHDLILPDHAADARDLGYVGDGLQLVFQEPVLHRAQLRQVHLARAVDQRVLVDPAHTRGVGSERRLGLRRQARLHLVQILEHARARPVRISAVLEQDVDEGIAEHRVAAHHLCARHRKHRRRQRVGDLVLDDLRCLSRIRRADDDLDVREIGDRVQRRA